MHSVPLSRVLRHHYVIENLGTIWELARSCSGDIRGLMSGSSSVAPSGSDVIRVLLVWIMVAARAVATDEWSSVDA